MRDYTALVDAIEKHTGGQFRNAEPTAIDQLRGLGLPEPVVAFFAKHEPAKCIEGQVRLWPISEIVRENRDFVPGCNTSQHGYVVFATTICGDTYCFDVNDTDENGEPRIVIISHEEDFEQMPAEQMRQLAKPVASSLTVFLQTFLRDELDEDCLYS